jgi:imidazolonepropionase-like amidohydrolase
MMNSRVLQGFRLVALFALCSFVLAPRSASASSLLLSNAVIHTVSGDVIPHGSVLIQNGKIAAVSDDTKPIRSLRSPDTTVLDLKGLHLYPGLIALDSALGLTEIESVRGTQDSTEAAASEYHPDVESWIAVNPDSEIIPVARGNGITHAEPAPQGGVVGGLSGLVALDGWTIEQMTIKHPTALHVYWPNMRLDTTPKDRIRDPARFKPLEEQSKERQAKLKALDDFFLEAGAYAKARAAGKCELNPPWEAMLPVMRAEVPLMVHANELRQIKAAVKWAQTNDYKIIIVGGRDAWEAADLLSSRKVPVIFEEIWAPPGRDSEAYDVNFKAPDVLRRAGVKVAFSNGADSFNTAMAKNLPYAAAQAVAFGLPPADALKGLTLYPAEILGVADRLGSIEAGKEATLFASDGDILDLRSNVKQMWIAGNEINLSSRHTRLYERYKNRPQAGQ